jgi:hypothetical protein
MKKVLLGSLIVCSVLSSLMADYFSKMIDLLEPENPHPSDSADRGNVAAKPLSIADTPVKEYHP